MHTKAKKTILVLTSTFPRWKNDHEPAFVFDLCRELKRHFAVIVLAPHCNMARKEEVLDGIRVCRYQYFFNNYQTLAYEGGILSRIKQNKFRSILVPFFLIAHVVSLAKIIKKGEIDYIHAHWIIPQGFCAVIVKKMFNCSAPIICTSHGGDLFALNGYLMTCLKKWVLKNCDKITVVSTAMCNVLINLGLPEKKISVISMGVDLSRKFIPHDTYVKQKGLLLFVGRLVEKKGVKYLIDAVSRVQGEHADVRLLIVGDGPEKKSLELKTKRLGLTKKISFLGAKTQYELIELYQKASIAVFPFIVANDGDQEGLGLVVIEAMGCCCATIVSDLPATHDVVNNNKNGLLVRPKDVDELASKIHYIIKNPGVAIELGQEGRNSMLRRYDWEIIGKRYIRLFNSYYVD